MVFAGWLLTCGLTGKKQPPAVPGFPERRAVSGKT
jgi:hypothetical protein